MQGRVKQEKFILSIPLPESAILHRILPSTLPREYWMSVYWEIHLAQRAILKELISNIPHLKIIYCTEIHISPKVLGLNLHLEILNNIGDI